jgi:integrase
MFRVEPNSGSRSLAVRTPRELSDSKLKTHSVRSAPSKHWQPPEGLSPEEVRAVIAAASCGRDQLLLRVLWATGARISEVLALRPMDVQRDSLLLPNRKNPNLTVKRVFLPGAELGLTGELLLWAKEQRLADDEPLFFSRKGGVDGSRRALQRGQAWLIVKQASERAEVRVMALRASRHGQAGEPAPIHPHLFRHARVRQIVRSTRNLPLAQRQAGWSRLQIAYLTIGDDEARQLMRQVTD